MDAEAAAKEQPAAKDPLELIDWHNWTRIRIEGERVGPGEQVALVEL